MSKIYTFLVLFSLLTFFASAQFNVGQKVVGGNVGFSVNNSKYYYNINDVNNQTAASVSPSIGWFTKANQLFGIGLMYNYNRQKTTITNFGTNNDTSTNYNHSIGVSLFSQRFITLGHNFYFTVSTTGSVAYNSGEMSDIRMGFETTRKTSGYSINIGLAPGLSYRLSQRFLFDAYLSNLLNAGFSHIQYKDGNVPSSDDKPHQNSFTLSSSLSNTSLGNVGLGFRWLLRK